MSSRLALLLVLTSLMSFNQCVESIRYDIPEAARKESERFENRHFREIPVYLVLWFGVINNTPDNSRFKKEIGYDHALGVLKNTTYFVQRTFGPDDFGRGYADVELTIESFGGNEIAAAIATTNNTKIRLNSMYVESFPGDVKYEFDGIIFHETTNMWLWTRRGLVPSGILTGIADFVRLKAGWPSRSWPKRGSGSRWTDGYDITAYFLEYCSHIKKDFVAELNSMTTKGYRDEYFAQLLGKDVCELWEDYKSLYGAKTAPTPSPRQGH